MIGKEEALLYGLTYDGVPFFITLYMLILIIGLENNECTLGA
jgi:hypothetical protein